MKIPFTQTATAITLFFKGKAPKVVDATHTNFKLLAQKLNSGSHDVAELEVLSSLSSAIKSYVSSAVVSLVTVSDGVVYYDGEPASGYIVDKILNFMKEGREAAPLMAFFGRLQANPSRRATIELYKFLEHENMPLTPDGHFLAYKGVNDDYWSKTANKETKVLQGKVNAEGRIFNGLGETIEVARNCVNDDANVGCAEGVHAGSYQYANGFKGSGGRLMVVEIDPADVVSVPHDCSHQKLRACKYIVVDELDAANPAPLADVIKSTIATKATARRDKNGRFVGGPVRQANGRFAKKS